MVSLASQAGIGFAFAVYGTYSLLRDQGARGKLPLSLACMLAGLFLLGYAGFDYNMVSASAGCFL